MQTGMNVCDPSAEREAVVARKRPDLAGSRHVKGHATGEAEDEDKGAECIEAGSRYRVAEDIEERIFGGLVEGVVNGCNAEEKRDEED